MFVQEMRHLFLWLSHISRAIGVAVWQARAMGVVCNESMIARAFVYVKGRLSEEMRAKRQCEVRRLT